MLWHGIWGLRDRYGEVGSVMLGAVQCVSSCGGIDCLKGCEFREGKVTVSQ